MTPREHIPRWVLDEQGVILSAEHTSHLLPTLAPGDRFPFPKTYSGNASIFFLKGKPYCYLPLENGHACVLATIAEPLLDHLEAAEYHNNLLPLPLQQTYETVKKLAAHLPEHKTHFETLMRNFRSLYRTNMLYREHVRLLLCANTPCWRPVSLYILFSQMQKLMQTSLPALEARMTFSLSSLPAMVKADELSLHQGFYFFVSHLVEKECSTIRLSEDARHTSVHFEGLRESNVLASAEGAFLKDVVESAGGYCQPTENGLTVIFPSCKELYLRASTDSPPSILFRTAFGPYLEL